MLKIEILTAGDSAILIEFGKEISPEINRKITAIVQLIKEQQIEGIVDTIPAFCSLLVNYDPRIISYEKIVERMRQLVKVDVMAEVGEKRIIEILSATAGILDRILKPLPKMQKCPGKK